MALEEANPDPDGAQGDPNLDDTNIDPPTLRTLLNALTTAIAQGFSNASRPSTDRLHSTSIDPYDSKTLDLETKEGKYQWAMVTKMTDGWVKLAVNVENADILMDLFRDR